MLIKQDMLIIVLCLALAGCYPVSSDSFVNGHSEPCRDDCAQQKRACYHSDTNGMVGPDMNSHKPKSPGICQIEYHQCVKACAVV